MEHEAHRRSRCSHRHHGTGGPSKEVELAQVDTFSGWWWQDTELCFEEVKARLAEGELAANTGWGISILWRSGKMQGSVQTALRWA